jgi:Putative beta-barrel porin-2, OmpL-like. bbp2
MRPIGISFRACLTAATCLTAVTSAVAQTAAPAPAAPAAPAAADAPPPGYWINGIHLSAQIEGGIVANPSTPKINDGQSFTDRANQPILNQVLLGAEKKLDPKATGFDWAFKLSMLYGADARYTHFLGFLDQAIPKDNRNQIDVVEASATLHAPVTAFAGGMDIKAGLYATPLGAELIDPSGNAFYSHSYIFNYALPLKHTGILTTSHVTPLVDFYAGVDTGSNTTFGPWGDDNNSLAGILGFGLNLMDGNLTVLALSHFGPENASRALAPLGFNANSFMRYYNDVVIVWKYSDTLTLTTEATWARDQFGVSGFSGHPSPANAFGIAQYASYTLTDTITLNGRLEVFRDDNGFFVAGFPGNYDPVYAQKGIGAPLNTEFGIAPATYGALTLGVTWKPVVPPPITSLAIRPEIRYDQSLGGNNVFNRVVNKAGVISFKDSGAFTFGTDVVLTF